MKKNIYKSLAIVFALLLQGCSDDEKTIDFVLDNVTNGAVLRTISTSGNTFNVLDTSSSWSAVLEEQDAENGGLFQEIRIYVSLSDNTQGNGTTSVDEKLLKTIPASSFSTQDSPHGLPRGTISVTFQEALDALDLSTGQYDGGDAIVLRLGLVLTDGREFTNNASGGVTGGSFFSSPYEYTNLLICELPLVPEGDWLIKMQDSYGDGWQTSNASGGSGITITLSNGDVIEVGLCGGSSSFSGCTPGDFEGTATVTIPPGITSAVWNFPGDVYGEISFQIYAPSGNLVASSTVGGSAAGPIALNLCNE